MAASTVLSEISLDEAAWLAEFARDVAERYHGDLVATLEEANNKVAQLTAEKEAALAEKAESAAALAEKEAELKQLRAQLAALQNTDTTSYTSA